MDDSGSDSVGVVIAGLVGATADHGRQHLAANATIVVGRLVARLSHRFSDDDDVSGGLALERLEAKPDSRLRLAEFAAAVDRLATDKAFRSELNAFIADTQDAGVDVGAVTQKVWDGPNAAVSGPNRVFMFIMVFLIVPIGWRGASYVADPATLPEPWLHVFAWAAAAATYLSTVVAVVFGYVFAFPRDVRAARVFAGIVANYAGIGALLGSLLGLRAAYPLYYDENYSFVRYIGIVGNSTMALTLAAVALCWLLSVGAVLDVLRANFPESRLHRAVAFALLLVANRVAWASADAVWHMLIAPPPSK